MSECRTHEESIRELLAGLLPPSGSDALARHAERCEHCRQILEAHGELEQAAARMVEPTDAEFHRMRERVMTTLRHRAAAPSRHRESWWGWTLGGARPALAAVALAALLIGAGFVGRWSASRTPADDEPWMVAIHAQAAAAEGVAESWDAPLVYSNVSARPADGGRLSLSFDVTRHVSMEAERESDLAKDVLVHAILDSSPVGSQVRAMGIARAVMDRRLLEAVTFALHHDTNVAVRLTAFDVLTQLPFDAAIQDALLTTLQTDESVQLRLKALEFLAAQRVGGDVLRQTIDEAELESDGAVRYRSLELTREL